VKENYFKTLFSCIIISFALLVGTTVMKFYPWSAVAAGIAPLVYYHLFYLRPRAKHGLSQAAVDSVYYFGFLVTVAALGISAVAIATSGAATNLNTVVFQFGVGLFATGYAVIARMHLSSISTLLDQVSPEAIMERYIKRSLELVDNVEMAVVRTSEFSTVLMSTTTQFAESARANAERAMIDIAKVFENEMQGTLALARDGLTEIRGLVSDTSFVSEREALARTIKATVEGAMQFNKALGDFETKAREGVQTAQQIIATSTNLEHSLRNLGHNINELADKDGALVRAAQSISVASEAITAGTSAVSETVDNLKEVAQAVSDTGPSFQKLRTIAKKTYEQLDVLSNVTGRFDGALANISQTTAATGSLATELGRVSSALSLISAKAGSLCSSLEKATDLSSHLGSQLTALPEHMGSIHNFTAQLTESLKHVLQSVEVAATESLKLTGDIEEARRVRDITSEVLSNANSLQATISGLKELMGGLATSVQATQSALAECSTGLKQSISSSAEVLQADVKRSTDAASLLTNRLIQVAQTIIDRTRQQQGAVT
jgi:hypothetical protein